MKRAREADASPRNISTMQKIIHREILLASSRLHAKVGEGSLDGCTSETALPATAVSKEMIDALNDESISSIAEVYGLKNADKKQSLEFSTEARTPDVESKPDGGGISSKSLKPGDAVLIRSAVTNNECIKGKIRAVIHGGFNSAKYDVHIPNIGRTETIRWQDVRLIEEGDDRERSGRDVNEDGGFQSGERLDEFGRIIRRKIPDVNIIRAPRDKPTSLVSHIANTTAISARALHGEGAEVRSSQQNPQSHSSASIATSRPIKESAPELFASSEILAKKRGGWRKLGVET